jgi:phenylacetate-CoA ligase
MGIKQFTKSLPTPIREKLKHFYYRAFPIQFRYGKIFREFYDFLCKSQWWSRKELEEYQVKQLVKLLYHAYENVPYYRRVFDERALRPKDIQNFDDLKKLPYLTKDEVRNNLEDLIAKNIPKENIEYATTGGTSGTPLGLYVEKKTNLLRSAFDRRYFNWGGYNFGDKCALLRGARVRDFSKGRRWEYDPEHNYLVLSTFDMTEENMDLYLKKLRAFKPKAIRGYPSALSILGDFAIENKIDINADGNILGIFTSSETIHEFQRIKIKQAFKANISDLYGNTEQTGRFGECERNEGYHEFSEYGIIEIEKIDDRGMGEIVATSFTNYAMPFIRYRTGDSARWSLKSCSCGRGLPLIDSLEGRMQDIAVLKDGTFITLTSFFFAVHIAEMNFIRKIQFIQESPGQLEALVVKGKDYINGKCESLLNKMNENLRSKLLINIKYVDDIELTKLGKHKFFIQKLDISEMYGRGIKQN